MKKKRFQSLIALTLCAAMLFAATACTRRTSTVTDAGAAASASADTSAAPAETSQTESQPAETSFTVSDDDEEIYMLFGINALIGAKSGMQEITLDATGAFECCKYFTFYYDIGADGSSPAAQKKTLRSLYSKAVSDSYQLFCADTEYEDEINLSYINSHPNTDIKVPHALYEALATLENSHTRYHYLAPIYELYASLFSCADGAEAASYDPKQNAALRAFFIQCAAYANDPASVGLSLLGDDTVRLFVSDEYMRFADDNAISGYIDLLWLKNAFCTDYIAGVLRENGYTRGTVISYDGFICHLGDAPETQFDYTFSHRQGNVIADWKTLSFAHPVSIVYLHDYPFGYEDEDNYYVYGSGETVFPFVDVSDGMLTAPRS